MGDLRTIIREVLSEELQALRSTMDGIGLGVSREVIPIAGDCDLNAFAKRLLSLADDPTKRADIMSGRLQFTLQPGSTSGFQHLPATVTPAPSPSMVMAPSPSSIPEPISRPQGSVSSNCVRQVVETGLMTEKHVERLPQETRAVTLGASVKLTPLARDELSRRNIKIERKAS